MKKSRLLCWIVLVLAGGTLVWGASPESATSHEPIYNVDTKWPDTKFVIVKVTRLDSRNVLMVVQVGVGSKADNPTFIGYKEKRPPGAPTNASPSFANKKQSEFSYKAFSLLDANVVDEADKTQHGAVGQTAGRPSYGPSIITTTMSPGNWLQLAVQFDLPAPTPNPDGTLPIQKVTVTLPQAKDSVRDVIVPPVQKT